MLKFAAICCTYKRPNQLAEAVECFRRQDYPANRRELIVVDDAGQYSADALSGIAGVKLITTRHRFRTLGEKRNASAAYASPDVDAYCVWDDDDIYLPWHISAAAAALADADYTIPTEIYEDTPKQLNRKKNQYLFHGAWSFLRTAFERVHGYPFTQSGQDQGFLQRIKSAKLRRADPIQFNPRPSYVYRWGTVKVKHISAMGRDGYETLRNIPTEYVNRLELRWSRDWVGLAR